MQENFKKSIISIKWEEHNLLSLILLLNENNIKVLQIIASDPREWAHKRVTNEFIPSIDTMMKVEATYMQIKDILRNSVEFNKFADRLIWTV